jgi:hypothetical protein
MSDISNLKTPLFSVGLHLSYAVKIGDVFSFENKMMMHPFTLVLDGLKQETPQEGARRITRYVLASNGLDYDQVLNKDTP